MGLKEPNEESSLLSKQPGGPYSMTGSLVGGRGVADWLSALSLLEPRAHERDSWPTVLLDALRPRAGRALLLGPEHRRVDSTPCVPGTTAPLKSPPRGAWGGLTAPHPIGMCECKLSRSVVSDSFQHYGPWPASAHGILQTRIQQWVAMPPPGNLPDPGVEPASLLSPALAGGVFTTDHLGSPMGMVQGN